MEVFNTIAETGSISKAAHGLHYVQSNVTAQIQQLETELVAQLSYTEPTRNDPTPAGEVLMRYTKRALKLAEEARPAVTAAKRAGAFCDVAH